MPAATSFSMRQVGKLCGLSRSSIETLVKSGIVQPVGGRFQLRDVSVLRAAKVLRDARIPPHRIVQAFSRARSSLADNSHLSSVPIRANGSDVELSDARGWLVAITGQRVLQFVEAEIEGPRSLSDAQAVHGARAVALYEEAKALESIDVSKAEAAYRLALQSDPTLVDAAIDLGALLCESGRFHQALEVLDRALVHGTESPLLHFNRAVALEGMARPALAILAYRRVLELEPTNADAHRNLAVLADELGEVKVALRHFAAVRRLETSG